MSPEETNPCRALLAAMLLRSIEDAQGVGGQGEIDPMPARVWIFEQASDAIGSFDWVCDHLDLDAEVMRKRIAEITGVCVRPMPALEDIPCRYPVCRCGRMKDHLRRERRRACGWTRICSHCESNRTRLGYVQTPPAGRVKCQCGSWKRRTPKGALYCPACRARYKYLHEWQGSHKKGDTHCRKCGAEKRPRTKNARSYLSCPECMKAAKRRYNKKAWARRVASTKGGQHGQ